MTDPELIDRATKASAVLSSPAYQEAWENTRQAILLRIESVPLSDTSSAEDLRKCLRLLRDVRANLELAMKQGKLPSFLIQQEEKRRKNPLTGLFR